MREPQCILQDLVICAYQLRKGADSHLASITPEALLFRSLAPSLKLITYVDEEIVNDLLLLLALRHQAAVPLRICTNGFSMKVKDELLRESCDLTGSDNQSFPSLVLIN
jgi:hypothetical protein